MDSEQYVTVLDFRIALQVQDACNLSGVVHSFSAIMEKLSKEACDKGYGTDWKNTHPISILFASKIGSLTGCETNLKFQEAYDKCQRMAGEY